MSGNIVQFVFYYCMLLIGFLIFNISLTQGQLLHVAYLTASVSIFMPVPIDAEKKKQEKQTACSSNKCQSIFLIYFTPQHECLSEYKSQRHMKNSFGLSLKVKQRGRMFSVEEFV